MGIPGLAKWVASECKRTTRTLGTSTAPPTVLHIDFNGILHTTKADPLLIAAFLRSLVAAARPSALVHIAVDGVAPRAKQVQQRARRAVRAAEDAARPDPARAPDAQPGGDAKKWDSNLLTPGTPLMDAMQDVVADVAGDLAGAFPHLAFVVSDARVPGEGEHKIIDFIRVQRMRPAYDPATVHMVYGSDADLFLLSMVTCARNVFLVREAPGRDVTLLPPPHFALPRLNVTDVARVRAHILKRLTPSTDALFAAPLPFAWDDQAAVDDFVFVASFLGNDFLPHAPALDTYFGGVDTLFAVYTAAIFDTDGHITHAAAPHSAFHPSRLAVFLEHLANAEHVFFDAQYGAAVPVPDWRTDYYAARYGVATPAETDALAAAMATAYVAGLAWIWTYYTTGPPSWTWHYPYAHAPLVADILALPLSTLAAAATPPSDASLPPHPLDQLMVVIPPASAPRALPPPLAALITSPASPIARFYPSVFPVDHDGRSRTWQAVPLLPPLDFDAVAAAAAPHIPPAAAPPPSPHLYLSGSGGALTYNADDMAVGLPAGLVLWATLAPPALPPPGRVLSSPVDDYVLSLAAPPADAVAASRTALPAADAWPGRPFAERAQAPRKPKRVELRCFACGGKGHAASACLPATRPQLACADCGRVNYYNHPCVATELPPPPPTTLVAAAAPKAAVSADSVSWLRGALIVGGAVAVVAGAVVAWRRWARRR